jgi:uroporphyrin-III C-methyltransferase
MKNNKGKVYIIGAGPGDPELISVKGYKLLQKAECVLYDFLSPFELVRELRPECEVICVGKADGMHLKEQDEINQLLLEKARQYDCVVRLKGGDPFLFSRGIEEARFLAGHGIPFEVVPGITSAFAAAAIAGIPLTIKDKFSSVAVVTGRKHDKDAQIDAPDCATLIYLMGVSNIANIIVALRKSGRPDDMPCAFVEKATHKDSRVIAATIGTIERETERAQVKAPAVLIVGEVVSHVIRGT